MNPGNQQEDSLFNCVKRIMNGFVMEYIQPIDQAFREIDDKFKKDQEDNKELPLSLKENFKDCLGLYIEDLNEKCSTVQRDGWIDQNERKYDAAKRVRDIESDNHSVYDTIFEALDRDNAEWGELHIVKDYNKASNDDTRYFPWRKKLFDYCMDTWEAFSETRNDYTWFQDKESRNWKRKRKKVEKQEKFQNKHAKSLMNEQDKEKQNEVVNKMTNFSSNPYLVSFSTTPHAAHTD